LSAVVFLFSNFLPFDLIDPFVFMFELILITVPNRYYLLADGTSI